VTALSDTASAKINLTLEVLGRRRDGFHEIRSLVAFCDLCDEIDFEPGEKLELLVEGPFAGLLDGGNLILEAAEAARKLNPEIILGRFRLRKNLPVAAGLGGGSADAAAALRLLAQANPETLDRRSMREIASELGADVTVCLDSRPAMVRGRGDVLRGYRGLPACGVILVNPGFPLPTSEVYAALKADAAPISFPPEGENLNFEGNLDRLAEYARTKPNDLEVVALTLAPNIREVLDALNQIEGVRFVRLSGSGPTCFALLPSFYEAKRAGALLQANFPLWWIASTSLRAR
jgi:4-diphosphocytidyl-2-C-methyl-D-erythritol kinase